MSIDEAELRKSVEKLIDALQKRVIENDRLQALLDEREAVIEQLGKTIQQLEWELRRTRLDGRRVVPLAKYVGVLLSTAVVSYGSARGAAHQNASPNKQCTPTVIDIKGQPGDDMRFALKACNTVIHVTLGADDTPQHADDETGSGLGRRLREVRARSGMSQHQLAAKLHVSRSVLSEWERGIREPQSKYSGRVRDVLEELHG